jgi:hypothetical protein
MKSTVKIQHNATLNGKLAKEKSREGLALCISSQLLGGVAKLRTATIGFVMPARPHGITWATKGRIFMKFDI